MAEPRIERAACAASGVYAFFDVDGTLVYRDIRVNPNGIPSPAVRAALSAFVDAGGTCVLCTGRSQGLVTPEVASLPFSGYVTMDGAHVEMGGRVIRDVAMPEDLVRRALKEMERLDISMIIESADLDVTLIRGRNWWPDVEGVSTAQEIIDMRPDLRFSKIVFHDDELEKFLSSDFLRESFVLFRLGDGVNEITVEGINKGAGLAAFVEALPEPPRQTIAFGDSENDVGMLEAADMGVVMANARPDIIHHVRALGGYVAPDVREDGVARALEHFGLIDALA